MDRTLRVVSAVLLGAGLAGRAWGQIGERPAIPFHMDQGEINQGRVPFKDLFAHGKLLFDARFNALDGRGRPGSTGGGAPRDPLGQPAFLRTSGPDSNACFGCHNQPRSGGGGDFVANVFVLAQTLDPVTFSVAPEFSNERNTLGMFGAGPIEMLAREMTDELQAIRAECIDTARATGVPDRRGLVCKGVDFGFVTALPDGRIDPAEIRGIDWDLIVKPFHQKGAVVSLREFTNNAMNHHHGIQSVERFGSGDPDQDGVSGELSVGDVTANAIYQAALAVPGRVVPASAEARAAVARGQAVFASIGCTECHIPAMTVATKYFSEPNPYNPPGNLRPEDVPAPFVYDMTKEGEAPRVEPAPGGGIVVRAFTDLKRHDLNDAELRHFANEQVPQGKLNGFAPPGDFTVPPTPRPTGEFLTRKLWDVGNSDPYGHRGDLTTMTEAIYYHGGESRVQRDAFMALAPADRSAVIEYLRTFQVVPPGNAN